MTDKEKMHSGELYHPEDEEIMRDQLKCLDRLYDFNMTRPTEFERRSELLREIGEHDREFYFKDRRIDKSLIEEE